MATLLTPEFLAEVEDAYDREHQAWFDGLSTEILTAMWELCCDWVSCPSWDDEVFDALAKRGHFDEVKA
jgi:hypothetical protein